MDKIRSFLNVMRGYNEVSDAEKVLAAYAKLHDVSKFPPDKEKLVPFLASLYVLEVTNAAGFDLDSGSYSEILTAGLWLIAISQPLAKIFGADEAKAPVAACLLMLGPEHKKKSRTSFLCSNNCAKTVK